MWNSSLKSPCQLQILQRHFFYHPSSVIETYDYVFAENGLVAYKDGKFLAKQVRSVNVCHFLFLYWMSKKNNRCLEGHYFLDML